MKILIFFLVLQYFETVMNAYLSIDSCQINVAIHLFLFCFEDDLQIITCLAVYLGQLTHVTQNIPPQYESSNFIPVDNFGTVVGENPTPYGILALWAVNGLSIVYWDIFIFNYCCKYLVQYFIRHFLMAKIWMKRNCIKNDVLKDWSWIIWQI